jgi:hypothetical protein
MNRIKITTKNGSYGTTYLLPGLPEDVTSRVAAILARAQQCSLRHIGDDYRKGSVLVSDPATCIDVQIVESDAVMGAKAFAQADAEHRQALALEQAKRAEEARRAAEEMPDDDMAVA